MQVVVQVPLQAPEQLVQPPKHCVLQEVLQALVQTSSHPKVSFLQDCNIAGAPVANKAIPNTGKDFFAASLKNCLLLWVSLFLFSIFFLPRLLPVLARRG